MKPTTSGKKPIKETIVKIPSMKIKLDPPKIKFPPSKSKIIKCQVKEREDNIRVKVYVAAAAIVSLVTIALVWFGDFSYSLTR